MSTYTLLDYVQIIASSLDSDEVNSIGDSTESLQIANIVKTVYNDVQARADLPEHYTMFQLDASTDPTKPVLMFRPGDVLSVLSIKYNKSTVDATDPLYQDIKFLPLDKFLDFTYNLKTSDDRVGSFTHTVNGNSIPIYFRTNKAPTYYTTYDDHTMIFDSYDAEVDDTLQSSKTLAYGKKDQEFLMEDTYVPFLDRDLSTLLLNEAKLLAFAELKQVGHDVAKTWASRGWTTMQANKRAINQNRSELDRAPDFGRKR